MTRAPRPLLIAGADGMLGHALQTVCARRGESFIAPVEADFDITSEQQVSHVVAAFAAVHPDGVLINAAAYTDVDGAEADPELAFSVNRTGARLLAAAAARGGLAFVHVSTAFVFGGADTGAYTEDDEPDPLFVYGVSRLAGERVVLAAKPEALIVRGGWVFGPGRTNFATEILERGANGIAVAVVSGEVGSPTYSIDLASGILELVRADARGIYHLANRGSCSRQGMAAELLRLAGRERVMIAPVSVADLPARSPRPANSVLDCSKAAALGVTMPEWHDALERFVAAQRR